MKFRHTAPPANPGVPLAPMIDIVFLLLIFFIVTWSFARFETELDVSVPAAEAGKTPNRTADEQIVNVRADGAVLLQGTVVDDAALLQRFATVAKFNPNVSIILRGDENTDFKHIIRVLDICSKANIWNVAFATARPTP